ncbi:MAG: succinate CoA transferase [Planctomycetota bacterium]|nr:succinate CoA transferase [Planctomycetota bacterium]
MSGTSDYPELTAEEAAETIADGALVAFSGFTAAGAAKVVPRALAVRARRLHAEGRPFRIGVLTGASTGPSIDDALAAAEAVRWRAPYQSSAPLRDRINRGETDYVDMHLSHFPQMVAEGFLGKIDVAVIEATEVTRDGRVFLSTSIGASPTFLRCAERVIIEVNRFQSRRLAEIADVVVMPPPPHRTPIAIDHPLDRIGKPYAEVDPRKVVGIVRNDEPDDIPLFRAPTQSCTGIAGHIVEFLLRERAAGRIPPEFLPFQSGVGNVANAVMTGLGAHSEIPPLTMYSEVLQDAALDLMRSGRLAAASTTSLTLSTGKLRELYDDLDFFLPKIVLRPQELSNHPEVVRRLGVIAMNTVLEVDVYGNANSTHICGTRMMNGIGGSGDFERNAFLSIVMCPSILHGGRVSSIVPMCPHVDHAEHSVQIVVTEQGLADLRGLGPVERARAIIDRCAHPAYRDYLRDYLRRAPAGHIRHDLTRCFELHRNFIEHGAMLPDLDLGGSAAESL